MVKTRTYRIFFLLTLVAFVGMQVVKCYHACHVHNRNYTVPICVADGMPLNAHSAHSHSSVVPYFDSDNECAICHFNVAKCLQPQWHFCGLTKPYIFLLSARNYLCDSHTFSESVSLRAPPCVG